MAHANDITNAGSAPGRPLINPWIIAVTVTLATFMEVLDSSIANVALPHIAGTLGASSEEGTWVITSYLVSSAIVLPMSGWLSNVIGRKRFYMACVAIFTISSLLCALATSLPMLIFFRILQGAGGGGLQPSEQAILADTFSAKQRGMAFAMYGMAVVVAPAIGPTLGGWLTDNYSWHWIFLINVPIGILSLMLTQRVVHDPAYLKNIRVQHPRGLYRHRPDRCRRWLLAVCARQRPGERLVRLEDDSRQLDRGHRCVGGAGHPRTLARRPDHGPSPARQAKLCHRGHLQLYSRHGAQWQHDPVAAVLAKRSWLHRAAGGDGAFARRHRPGIHDAGCGNPGQQIRSPGHHRYRLRSHFLWTLSRHQSLSRRQLCTMVTYRMIQVIGIPLIFIPISTLNYVGVPRNKFNQVSGISSFTRNVGGAIGVSLLNNFITRQGQIHRTALTAHTNHANPFFERQLNAMTQNFVAMGASATEASHRALAQLSAQVDLQANVLGFVNAFWMLGLLVMFLIPLPFIMQRPSPEEAKAAAAAH